ncbi:MAG TPA: SUMF1/EgtB/PvdO family nonheme iron enzyme [Pyrinomonadaceae bacterium]|jgi:formylglycine-generating enzyme required for sulfatase activity
MGRNQLPRSTRFLVLAFVMAAVFYPAVRPMRAQKNGRGGRIELPQQRGLDIRGEDGKPIKLYDKSYALLIGVSDYLSGWPKLPGVKQDIPAVRAALEQQGFQTVVVLNPTGAQLEEAYRSFIQQYGLGVENRLLFYFAGHGHTIKQSYGEDMGYIVPVDAPNPRRDPASFMAKALDMQSMELYARRIQSKHALFLFDSCFSGSLFALSRSIPDNISYKTSLPVRQFITSGSANEQVPDRSIFREQFIAALEGAADNNHDGYVTGSELGDFLQDRVVNYTHNAQHPQYGKIRNPNLDKGDFVFVLPPAPAPAPPVIAPNNAVRRAPPTPTPPVRVDPAQQELAFWSAIQNSADPDDFKDYLLKYPNGLYAGIARRRIAMLSSIVKPPPPKPTESSAAAPAPSVSRPLSPSRPVLTNQAGIELVWIPPGSFAMGSANGNSNERPVHEVSIREGFYMGRYEVTQAQWQGLMGSNPSSFKGTNFPVEQVSWADAVAFIARLNAQHDGYTYRLPTEAEWEYAARAGTTGDYAGELEALAWYGGNSGSETHPVGRKLPNAFGLYDMHGNVWEWCADFYHDTYAGAPTDGSAWLTGGTPKSRVMRGGSWYNNADLCRAASRDWLAPNRHGFVIGLRVVASARP